RALVADVRLAHLRRHGASGDRDVLDPGLNQAQAGSSIPVDDLGLCALDADQGRAPVFAQGWRMLLNSRASAITDIAISPNSSRISTASLDGDTGPNIVSFVKTNLLSPTRAI